MDTNNKHIYNEAEIRRYLNGEMTPLEMHDLERAALDDPFLAEALEGYEGMQVQGWEKGLAAARLQLVNKTSQGAVISIPRRKSFWLYYAAAMLVLAIGSYITFTFLKSDNKMEDTANTVAQNYPVVSEAGKSNAIPADSVITAPDKLSATDTAQKRKIPVDMAGKTFVVRNPVISADENTTTGTAKTNSVESAPNLIAASDADKVVDAGRKQYEDDVRSKEYYSKTEVKDLAKEQVQPAAAPTDAQKVRMDISNQAFKNFIASVVSDDGTPLPFANVTIRNEGIGTYADNQGQFRLISQDSILTVDVKSIGHESMSFKLNSGNKINRIVLPESRRVESFYDVSSNAKRKAGPAIRLPRVIKDSSLFNVEPADGWEKYNTYVANNLNLDEMDIDNKQKGTEVEISFDVQENGTITNITVDARNCSSCEQAARKLVQQGPQWRVKNGQKGRARIKLSF